MNEEIIIKFKEVLNSYYKVLKESYEESKLELYAIDQQLFIFNKLFGMVKSSKDFNKKEVRKFYEKEVEPILVDCVDDIADEILEINNGFDAYRLETIVEDDDIYYSERMKLISLRVNQLKEKKESIPALKEYQDEINKIKKMLKSLSSNAYYEDETAYNTIIDSINSEDIIEYNEELIKFIENKRIQYLEQLKKAELERKLRKEILDAERAKAKASICESNTLKDDKIIFNYNDFFSDDDLELMKEINSLIYQNSNILNNITDEIIRLIKEVSEYEELGVNLDVILKDYNITNYKNITILFDISKLMSEIKTIVDYIRNNNIDYHKETKYYDEVSKLLMNIGELYVNYEYEKTADNTVVTPSSDYHIIYLTNSSNQILLENDIEGKYEDYRYFIKLLEDLKAGRITNNPVKDGRYTHNDKLTNVCKKKEFRSRIIYYPYDNCYIVFLGFTKKNQNNSYEISLVKNRFSYYKKEIDNIIKSLSDSDMKDQIIKQNDDIHKQLIERLKSKARNR